MHTYYSVADERGGSAVQERFDEAGDACEQNDKMGGSAEPKEPSWISHCYYIHTFLQLDIMCNQQKARRIFFVGCANLINEWDNDHAIPAIN